MDGAWSMCGLYKMLVENLEGRDSLKDVGIDGRII
jgi:hypothetical protein